MYQLALFTFITCCTIVGFAFLLILALVIASAIRGDSRARVVLGCLSLYAVCTGLAWSSQVLFK